MNPELYLPKHRSQYDAGCSNVTRHAGCTWTVGAMGADACTGGRLDPTPDDVHAQLARAEEQYPATPGWTITDLATALDRMGVGLKDRTGDGWDAAIAAAESDHYLVLQGMSSEFGDHTCSGAFDGPHAIGWHPQRRTVGGIRKWWINDPICSEGRWEREDVLRRYATAFHPLIRFGVFGGVVQPVRPRVTWSDDVLPETQAVTSAATARSAIRKSGHEPGYVINEKDLRSALRHEGVPYGTRVNPGDLRRYMRKVDVDP